MAELRPEQNGQSSNAQQSATIHTPSSKRRYGGSVLLWPKGWASRPGATVSDWSMAALCQTLCDAQLQGSWWPLVQWNLTIGGMNGPFRALRHKMANCYYSSSATNAPAASESGVPTHTRRVRTPCSKSGTRSTVHRSTDPSDIIIRGNHLNPRKSSLYQLH